MDARAISMIPCCGQMPMLRIGKSRDEAWHPVRIGDTVLPVYLHLQCRACGRLAGPGPDELQTRLAWDKAMHPSHGRLARQEVH
jgi:hypothetical protein